MSRGRDRIIDQRPLSTRRGSSPTSSDCVSTIGSRQQRCQRVTTHRGAAQRRQFSPQASMGRAPSLPAFSHGSLSAWLPEMIALLPSGAIHLCVGSPVFFLRYVRPGCTIRLSLGVGSLDLASGQPDKRGISAVREPFRHVSPGLHRCRAAGVGEHEVALCWFTSACRGTVYEDAVRTIRKPV